MPNLSRNKFGIQWSFSDQRPNNLRRIDYTGRGLQLTSAGSTPADR